MAGTNDFKAFATDANANVTSQEEWETLTALKKGFSSGKASSAQVSKALRQPSTMAAVLGQFIANAELDALDDGDVDGLVAKLATAITTNLGLGEGSFGFRNLVAFTTAGVTNWTVPEELRKGRKCYVKVIGGGASGGMGSTSASGITCGGGGGGGGVAEGLVDLTGINSVSITVGAGGAPVYVGSSNGRNGGSSSFGAYMSASGGYSGGQPSGGLGAVGVGGTINTSLGPGSPGSIASAASGAGNGGSGGGPGGAGSFRDTANGKAVSAVGPGGGGAGLCPNSSTGQSGAGADGAVYIYW